MNRVMLSIMLFIACSTNIGNAIHNVRTRRHPKYSQWGLWSPCSTSCGEGVRQRTRQCIAENSLCSGPMSESKHCFLQFCPSYLSWPRIHFSGKMVADVNTVNNIRCAYENEEFSAAELKKQFEGLQKMATTHTYYKFASNNWNPDGTNHIYLQDTFVTSLCVSPQKCSTSDPIVGLKVTEATRGVMAVLDVDWQYATEIWGFKILIPGVLQGDVQPSSHQYERERFTRKYDAGIGYSIATMSRYKSKIVNITWNDGHYRDLFKNASVLSISFVMDLFHQESLEGRISGTIGRTSEDDPAEMLATRNVLPSATNYCGPAPFFVYYDSLTLTLDLSYSIVGREDGNFLAQDIGKLDLGIMLSKKTFCKYFSMEDLSMCFKSWNDNSLTWRWITKGGEISRQIGNDSSWYNTYGGVLDIDIRHLDPVTLRMLRHKRLVVLKESSDGSVSTYLKENAHGVVIGTSSSSIIRLNPGESHDLSGFVSSYGRPVKNVPFDVLLAKNVLSNTDCGRPSCNRSIGIPEDALQITHERNNSLTNKNGAITLNLKAVKDPGTPRGCGLDGQLYPLRIFVSYSYKGRVTTFSECGTTSDDIGKVSDYSTYSIASAVRIYNSVEEKMCPVWNDVKKIFIQYYNLYPAMWKSGIIDLHSYTDIVKKARMLKVAMFETAFNSPRFMPITRDLSEGNRKMIWNWMKCGMRRTLPPKTQATRKICTDESIQKDLKEIRALLHKAAMLELSTIPPYVTAWLSLKTEYGRNKDVADILKSVFNEEMLHMSLAGNILNAVGGVVNMTDESKLPIYPNILASGDYYEIFPDVQVALGPFSLGLVQDIFSKIEKPSNEKDRKLMHYIGELWKLLPDNQVNHTNNTDKMITANMRKLVHQMTEIENSTFNKNINKKSSFKSNFTSNPNQEILQAWKALGYFADQKLKEIVSLTDKTVGEFYTAIALKLTSLESCVRATNIQNLIKKEKGSNITNSLSIETIFSGSRQKQLNISHWYQESKDSIAYILNHGEEDVRHHSNMNMNQDNVVVKDQQSRLTRPTLFEVVDLRTALEAIVDIVYQGEGGSDCSPFVTEPWIYASERGRDQGHELSHYYRFQEIVYGRKLVKVQNSPFWNNWKCLNASLENACSNLLKANESYCYAGKQITFYEDGVWPILSNPQDGMYRKGSKAFRLHNQFNILYTRLLYCLQETFGGNPSHMKTCMSLMYDLTIVGKRLVSTPLRVPGNSTTTIELGTTGKTGCPTWSFVREKPYRAGLPLRL